MSSYLSSLVAIAHPDEMVSEVIARMVADHKKYFGICLVVDDKMKLLGIFNHGDVLRLIARGGSLGEKISEVMITEPVVVNEGLSDSQILEQVRMRLRQRSDGQKEVTQFVPVVNSIGEVVDILDMYDVLARSPRQSDQVIIYGLGFVGLTLAVVLASRGHIVTGVDINEGIVGQLKKGKPHVFEPRLPEMMRKGLASGNLIFQSNTGDCHNKVVIITVGTPVDKQGKPSMAALEAVCSSVGPRLRRGDMVILRSTVPVGTTRTLVIPLLERLSGLKVGKAFHVSFSPERTVEGKAIQELSSLPQIVSGVTASCVEKASAFWSMVANTVVRVESLEAAELIKLVNNSFRDLSFSFANGLALLTDRYNIDASKLIAAANEGYPRDPIPKPSPGVGGYCLTKDPFLYASVENGLWHGELARIGRKINRAAGEYPITILERFSERIGRHVGDLSVLIVGMAFKGWPETNDLRGSIAVDVARELMRRQCQVLCFDVVVTARELKENGFIPVNMFDVLGTVDVLFILNNHPGNIPDGLLENIGNGRPVLLFDGWNMLERQEVEKYSDVTYSSMGYMTVGERPALERHMSGAE